MSVLADALRRVKSWYKVMPLTAQADAGGFLSANALAAAGTASK